MKLRIILLLFLIVYFNVVAISQTNTTKDNSINYSKEIIEKILLNKVNNKDLEETEEILNKLGDQASIALMKCFLQKDKFEDKTYIKELILPIIKSAFNKPHQIQNEIDKSPQATILFLDFMKCKTKDNNLKNEIEQVELFIKDQTKQH